jgi:hypothetical protein
MGMAINIYIKSEQLLTMLANSLHDRERQNIMPVYFTLTEIQLVEKWLNELAEEIKKDV